MPAPRPMPLIRVSDRFISILLSEAATATEKIKSWRRRPREKAGAFAKDWKHHGRGHVLLIRKWRTDWKNGNYVQGLRPRSLSYRGKDKKAACQLLIVFC